MSRSEMSLPTVQGGQFQLWPQEGTLAASAKSLFSSKFKSTQHENLTGTVICLRALIEFQIQLDWIE